MTRIAVTSPARSRQAGIGSSPACATPCYAATAARCCSSRATSAFRSNGMFRGYQRKTSDIPSPGPAATQQVTKFTNAIIEEMRRHGVAGQKLGVDFIDINMIEIFKEKNITWADGMSAMMDARAVKSEDEQECFRIVGAIGDAAHWECMKFLRPGITENQVTAHLMQYLYNIPGMEDVEDVIVSSGPNTWPNWRNFSDRIIQPGDIVFMDLAALTWNGYKSCYYRTYCVGKEPSQEQKDTYATALKWLYDSIGAVKVGATTRDIALKWPSAMETWPPPTSGATASVLRNTIRRSFRASGRSTIRSRSRKA